MAADDAAVVVTLRADIKDYEAALKAAVRATERAAKATEDALASVGKKKSFSAINQNARDAGASLGAMQANAKNLGFQFNDLATSIASGGGVLRAFAQQGGQIAQIFSGMGIKQIGATIVASLVDPFVLIPIAIGVATTALTAYFSTAEKGSDKANKELKKHADELRNIAAAYEDLAPKAKKVIDLMLSEQKATEDIDKLKKSIEGIRSDSVDKLNTALKGIRGVSNETKKALDDAFGREGRGKLLEGLAVNFQDLIDKITAGKDVTAQLQELLSDLEKLSVKAPNAGFDKMIEVIRGIIPLMGTLNDRQEAVVQLQDAITQSLDKSHEAAVALVTAASSLAGPFSSALQILAQFLPTLKQAEAGLKDFAKVPGMLIDVGSAMPGLNTEAVTATGDAARTFLKGRAATDAIAASMDNLSDETAKAAAKLFTLLPPTAKVTSAFRSYAQQAAAYARYKSGTGGLAAKPGHSRHEVGEAFDVSGVNMDTLHEAVKMVPELEQLKGRAYEADKVHVQLAGTSARMDKEAADATMKRADSYAALLEQSRQATDQLTAEQQALAESGGIVQDFGYKIAFAKQQQELLNKAQSEGIVITPQVRKEIAEAADAYARATATLKFHQEAAKASADRLKDQAAAAKQFSQEIGNMAESAFGGLVNDLRNGVDAGEAFNNMLNRILDSLIQMSIQSLFNPAGGGGIGGWLASLVPQAHSGGSVSHLAGSGQRKVSPLAFANAPRYAAGGIAGLAPGEIPAILHRGEIIVPNARRLAGSGGGRVDNSVHQQNRISIDMSGSGYVAANSENAKQVGQNMQKLIQAELVRESRPGGLLRQVPR